MWQHAPTKWIKLKINRLYRIDIDNEWTRTDQLDYILPSRIVFKPSNFN
jgi:hypothetical protein